MKSVPIKGVTYHDRLASQWSALYSKPSFYKRMQLFDSILSEYVKAEDSWLDAGCGSGVLAQLLLEKNATVCAVDASEPMLKSAKANLEDALKDGSIEFQQIQTLEDLRELDSCFDGVLCSSVIEYVHAPELVLAELRRVLKCGGLLIISVPNKFSIVRIGQKTLRALGKLLRKNITTYLDVSVNAYSKEEFYKMLVRYGFECIQYNLFDPVVNSNFKWWPGSLHVFVAIQSPDELNQSPLTSAPVAPAR